MLNNRGALTTKKTVSKRRKTNPPLRFSPTAWSKLLYLRDAGSTEVGGFGITDPDDLLYVRDLRLVRQTCSAVSVVFDDLAVADYFDQQVDAGLKPEQFARVWIHTHPGNCPAPSWTDEKTFARVFGSADWALMFILACGGDTYARLRFNAGPGGNVLVPTEVDYSKEFDGSDPRTWEQEYLASVQPAPPAVIASRPALFNPFADWDEPFIRTHALAESSFYDF